MQTLSYLILYKLFERAASFGTLTLLQLWLLRELDFSEPTALLYRSLVTALVYGFCIVGGYFSDVVLGPYATLVSFTVPYTLGIFGLALVSYVDATVTARRWIALASLVLFALGSGATKPCSTVVGAEQLPSHLAGSKAEADAQVKSFTTTFYLVCQIGGLSLVATPLLQHHTSYEVTFMALGGLSALSLLVLGVGDTIGTRATGLGSGSVVGFRRPGGQPFVLGTVMGVIRDNHCCCGRRVAGVRRSSSRLPRLPSQMPRGSSHASTATILTTGSSKEALLTSDTSGTNCDNIEWEVAQTLRVFRLFLPLIAYSGLTFQTFSSWQTQATILNLNTHIFGNVLVEQLPMIKFLMVIPLLPLCKKLPLQPLARMGWGFAFTGLAFLSAALLQTHAQRKPGEVSVYYQLVQYFFLSIGETLVSPSLLQFAYTEAPPTMKTVVQAGANVTDVVGNGLAGVCFKWLPASLATQFYAFGGVMLALATVVHVPLAKWYSPLPAPPRPAELCHVASEHAQDGGGDSDAHGHDNDTTKVGSTDTWPYTPPPPLRVFPHQVSGGTSPQSPAMFDRIREMSSAEVVPDLRLSSHPDSAEDQQEQQEQRTSAGETPGRCRAVLRRQRLPSVCPPSSAVVIVDPFSSGALMASQVPSDNGMGVVRVLSRTFPQAQLDFVPPGLTLEFVDTITHDNDATDQAAATDATAASLQALAYQFVAVIAGSEPGVELTDALAEKLGLRGNATELSACRRDKYLMVQRLHTCRVRAAQQMLLTPSTPADTVNAFLRGLRAADPTGNGWVVAKPTRSCGGDDVTLCLSPSDVFRYQERVLGSRNNYGMLNSEVVLQEFLHSVKGSHDEYVVDTVSKGGVHKVVAVWEYDKRPTNGAPFVYFGMRLVSPTAEEFEPLCAYACEALDALGIRWGPSHAEVMLTASGPVLVEVGARLHGVRGSFVPLVSAAVGYDQVSVTLAAYGVLDDVDFDALPARYTTLRQAAAQVFLISRHTGTLRSLPRLAEIRGLPSWHADDIKAPGAAMVPTQDGWSSPGYVSLLHPDPAVVLKNYTTILNATGFRANRKWEPATSTPGLSRRRRSRASTLTELGTDGRGELFDIVVDVVEEGAPHAGAGGGGGGGK